MKKIRNPWLHKEGYKCFGCSPDNPMGLKMEFNEDEEDVVCIWHPSEYYQGWINTLHGGIESTLLDECCGWVVTHKLKTTGVTSQLNVRFLKPISTLEPQLIIRAHLVEMKRNLAFIDAEIINGKGEICTTAQSIYYTYPHDKAVEMGWED